MGFFRALASIFKRLVLSKTKLDSEIGPTGYIAAPFDGTGNSGQFFCDGLAKATDVGDLLGAGIFAGALVNLNSGGDGGGGGGGGGGSAPSGGGEGPGGQTWTQLAANNAIVANSARLHTQSR